MIDAFIFIIYYKMFIPGSHNSGMYTLESDRLYTSQKLYIMPNFLKKSISYVTLNQNLSISDQLNIGIKYLTFKLCKIDDQIYVTHTFVGPAFELCVRDICNYISFSSPIIYITLTYVTDISDSEIIALFDKYSKYWRQCLEFIHDEIPYLNTTDIDALNDSVLHTSNSFSYTLTPSIMGIFVNKDITSNFINISKHINVSNFTRPYIFINFDFVNKGVVDAVQKLNDRNQYQKST
jgi:hypothetical protein